MSALQSKIEEMVNSRIESAIEKAVSDAIGKIFGGTTSKPKKSTATTGAKRGRKPKNASDDATPRSGSLQDHVLAILDKKPEGMRLRDVIVEVKKLVDNGKYETSSENIAPSVAQALNGLKKKQLVVKEEKNYIKAAVQTEQKPDEGEETEAETEVEAEAQNA